RLAPSLGQASTPRGAAAFASRRTSNYHVQYLSTEKINPAYPDAPKGRKHENEGRGTKAARIPFCSSFVFSPFRVFVISFSSRAQKSGPTVKSGRLEEA
ncbi:MAG TPA: hypothetical protein VN699_02260, partial [Pirellulales bacterium]|nr:hypothetical protein [Pirellulales bacterium]